MCDLKTDNLDEFRQVFDSQLVTQKAYLHNPVGILEDQNLVVRIGGTQYYEWKHAQTLVMAKLAFSQQLFLDVPSLNQTLMQATVEPEEPIVYTQSLTPTNEDL